MSFGLPKHLEIYRCSYHGAFGDRTNGLLVIPARELRIMFSNGEGWEHVSVSHPERCPTWEEMSWVREQFWDAEATVLQFHPPQSQYVNHHPHCLHLWRQIDVEVALPPIWMIGPRRRA